MTEAARSEVPLVVNGWSIFAHPTFLDQFDELTKEVETCKDRHPTTWRTKNCTKRLAAVVRLVAEVIPAGPNAPQFRQGNALGENRKHWFRAKFFQRYRLFFRFDSKAKVIVLAWVNDRSTLRARGRRTDAYAAFRSMLDGGNPPEDFETLMKEAANAVGRFGKSLRTTPDR